MSAKHSILIVDDNLDMCEVVSLQLEYEGFHVVTASDHNSALDALSGMMPDVLLLDHNLPRMSCEAFVPTVRTLRPGMPIVLVSGIVGLKERAQALNVDHFLLKPFEPSALVALLNQLIANKPKTESGKRSSPAQ
jgi:CheY-like chemotaxis protein